MKLTVQKKITTKHDNGYSYTYDISIDGKTLGKGVTGIDLKMDAGLKPRLTINCVPDEIDVDVETLTALNVLQK
ncbi:hypothetical protein ABC418_17225 [Lactiplantibacillus plantarum]|uniref:hypothetical protein n=1 Tax=Lactiplantibacillus plantarum TaxID=1590 RepID=UPI003965C3E5